MAAVVSAQVLLYPPNFNTTSTSAPTKTYGAYANSTTAGMTCMAYKWENISTYFFILGNDAGVGKLFASISTNTTNNFGLYGCLTCSYSRTNDFFIFGGSDGLLTFFNGTSNNNTLVGKYTIGANVTSSDFSDDGYYLVVGLVNGVVNIYTQNCLPCMASYFYNATIQMCELCITYISSCMAC